VGLSWAIAKMRSTKASHKSLPALQDIADMSPSLLEEKFPVIEEEAIKRILASWH
jgi:hypothetical protein